MDAGSNNRATALANAIARTHGWTVEPRTALFDDGTEGYSFHLRRPTGIPWRQGETVVTFHNDDRYGPRWSGLAGARIPGHKVIPYVQAYAEDPDVHPGVLNGRVLGI